MQFENCEMIGKVSSKDELLTAVKAFAESICSNEGNHFGLGAWKGSIKSLTTGTDFGNEHLALFGENGMIAPFGEMHDATTEKLACLLGLILKNHDLL